jgi:hypothetical protein
MAVVVEKLGQRGGEREVVARSDRAAQSAALDQIADRVAG